MFHIIFAILCTYLYNFRVWLWESLQNIQFMFFRMFIRVHDEPFIYVFSINTKQLQLLYIT